MPGKHKAVQQQVSDYAMYKNVVEQSLGRVHKQVGPKRLPCRRCCLPLPLLLLPLLLPWHSPLTACVRLGVCVT